MSRAGAIRSPTQETRSPHERIETARHSRVFPGQGVHSEKVIDLIRALDEMGYHGDYSFEVFNDERARRSVKWITARVGRWSLPARRRA
jgi:sugar phosphate isomerase/epimerase